MSKCLGRTRGEADQKYRPTEVRQEERWERGPGVEEVVEKNGVAAWSEVEKEHSGKKDLRRWEMFYSFFFLIQSFAPDSNKDHFFGNDRPTLQGSSVASIIILKQKHSQE